MIKNGYEVVFKQSSCIIHDQAGKKIAEVEMIKNSFHLKLSSIEETTMLAQSQNEKLNNQQTSNPKGIIEKKSEIGNKYVEHQTKKNGAEAVKQKSVAEFKNQRGSETESKREQKMIGEVISKDMKKIQDRLEEDAEKTHGKVKGSQESRHRGFNFQNSASGKSNVMKTGEINLDPEYLESRNQSKDSRGSVEIDSFD